MSYADAALPSPRIDAKRIAATSGAIAVHIAILMMLMMPPEVKENLTQEDVIVPNWEKPKELVPPPPPPPTQQPQVLHQTRVPTPVAIPDPPVEAVDTTPSPIDLVAPPIRDTPPPNTFDAGAMSSEFQQLAIANGPPPTYPKMAVTRGIEGTVVLRIHVDASGKPMEVSVEQSSGSRILDEAALRFVKAHWSFVPAQSGGQAIDAWGLVPIQYVLQ
jgi:protein TonB